MGAFVLNCDACLVIAISHTTHGFVTGDLQRFSAWHRREHVGVSVEKCKGWRRVMVAPQTQQGFVTIAGG